MEAHFLHTNNNRAHINGLDDLLALTDIEFVRAAYNLILKRDPDPSGFAYYLKRLRSGVERLDILLQLRNSHEAHSNPWVDKALRSHSLSKIPIFGALFKKPGRDLLMRVNSMEERLSVAYESLAAHLGQIHQLQSEISTAQRNLAESLEIAATTSGDEDDASPFEKKAGDIAKDDFDGEWYLSQYPDVARAGLDPYEHYVNSGRVEGRLALRKGGVQPQLQAPDQIQRVILLESSKKWPRKPLISILMPVYNTPERWLRDAIDSVIAQIYPAWELCIVDDASTESHVRAVLREYQERDSRIKVTYQTTNKRVSATSNCALEMATGEYTVLFDHDDLLECHALYRVAEAIIEHRPDIVYSDELIVSEDADKIIGHAFRPAFSLELLRSHPYIVHLVGFRTDLIRRIGGFDENLRISQDYDLILRAVEQAKNIVHIAEALYRWRTYAKSSGHGEKERVMETSKGILSKHLSRCGHNATVNDGLSFNFFDVRYHLQPDVRVAIVIPTKNHGDLVRQCIESIERTTAEINYDIIVVDHASNDPRSLKYFDDLRKRHTVLRYEGEFNFSTINNWAIGKLTNRYSHYLLCNNDIEAIHSGWLERMVELAQQPDVGVVGAKLYYPDARTIQHAGVCVGMFGAAEHYGKFMDKYLDGSTELHPGYIGSLISNREMSSVTAACMLVRSDAFEAANGFDELAKVGFGDVDLCLRIRQGGHRVVFCPHAELIHHESLSRGKSQADPHPEDSLYFQNRWKAFIEMGDPFYNPNLTAYNTFWGLKRQEEFELQKGTIERFRSYRKHR